MDRKPVLLAWHAGPNFGWGVVGRNIFRHWAMSPELSPLSTFPITDIQVADDVPARIRLFCMAVLNSNRFAEELARQPPSVGLRMPVIHPLGNHFARSETFRGVRNIGRMVFEDTDIEKSAPLAELYDVLVCASEWNADILRSTCKVQVRMIPETVDHDLFFPDPEARVYPRDRFHIFTGGKIEFRKAQDLVLMAFREFSRRHDDAVLVTAWHSPWPTISAGFQGKLDMPLALHPNGRIDVARWVADNGIDPDKVIDLGPQPNFVLPALLRGADCALQPSRAEGANNMVVMEAMACGLPVIVARNSGMHDVIRPDNCIALERQTPVQAPNGGGTSGWGESDVEEILDALERLYVSKALRTSVGARASRFMRERNWSDHAEALKVLALSTL